MSEDRRALLERHGRCYGELHLVMAFTRSRRLDGDDFKTAIDWQKSPIRLADGDHGSGLLAAGGTNRNPVVCLRASGLLGVDIDGAAGRALVHELIPAGLPPTVAVRSGRDGGHHLWYQAPEAAAKMKIQFAERLTLSSDGYLVCPPSWHAEAERHYEFVEGHSPWEMEIAAFPAGVLARLAGRARDGKETHRRDDTVVCPKDHRHERLLEVAGALRRIGCAEETIAAALLAENASRCSPPKDEPLVRALARGVATRYRPGRGDAPQSQARVLRLGQAGTKGKP